jgi:hypothetical protein
MQQNPGFLVLHSFVKDALLSKVGLVKVWWETREELERQTYPDLDDAASTASTTCCASEARLIAQAYDREQFAAILLRRWLAELAENNLMFGAPAMPAGSYVGATPH